MACSRTALARSRRSGVVAVLLLAAVIATSCTSTPANTHQSSGAVSTPSSPAQSQTSADPSTSSTVPSDPPATTPRATHSSPPSRPAITTRGGMWWGVDSTTAINAQSLANVQGWYRGGHRPQFWGRYLTGNFAVSRTELAFARTHSIYVYLIVTDDNCSQCGGGDICGNDRTVEQARIDARQAVADARALRVPRRAVLYKDIEQVSSCRGEPTAAYLIGWYTALKTSAYRTGFYGNTYRQNYDFPVAYCAAVARDREFASHVVLDMNEPEPQISAPRNTIGPSNAPRFAPYQPSCTPPGKTMIWQYGESTDYANMTDVDQARPNTPGMLAPDGSIT